MATIKFCILLFIAFCSTAVTGRCLKKLIVSFNDGKSLETFNIMDGSTIGIHGRAQSKLEIERDEHQKISLVSAYGTPGLFCIYDRKEENTDFEQKKYIFMSKENSSLVIAIDKASSSSPLTLKELNRSLNPVDYVFTGGVVVDDHYKKYNPNTPQMLRFSTLTYGTDLVIENKALVHSKRSPALCDRIFSILK